MKLWRKEGRKEGRTKDEGRRTKEGGSVPKRKEVRFQKIVPAPDQPSV
jgi:hypothetical protein